MTRRTMKKRTLFSGTPEKRQGRSHYTAAGMAFIEEHCHAPPLPDFSKGKKQTLEEFFGPLYRGERVREDT